MPSLEIEERVARLEGRLDEHSKFFESISVKLTLLEDRGDRNREELEKRIIALEGRIDGKIDSVRSTLDTNFRWIVGIQITTWITILLAILFKH